MKDNMTLRIWRIIYPLGTHFLISQFVVTASAVLVSTYAVLQVTKCAPGFIGVNPQTWTKDVIAQNSMFLTLIVSLLTLPILYFYLWKDRKWGLLQKDIKLTPSISLVLIGAVASSVGMNLLIGISPLIEWSPTYQKLIKVTYTGNVALELVTAALVVPIVEELLFRGLLYGRLKKEMEMWVAAIGSSVVFGLYHQNVVQFVYATFLGFLFVFFMEKTGSLKGAILAHMMANFVSVISSETSIMKWIYYNNATYLATTAVCILLTGIVILIFMKKTPQTDIC